MENFDFTNIQNIIYMFSAMLFITGIKMLGKESTAQKGNFISATGMLLAVSATAINIVNPLIALVAILLGGIIGAIISVKVKFSMKKL